MDSESGVAAHTVSDRSSDWLSVWFRKRTYDGRVEKPIDGVVYLLHPHLVNSLMQPRLANTRVATTAAALTAVLKLGLIEESQTQFLLLILDI